MRPLSFIFASAVVVATVSPGIAQYLPPSPGAQYAPPSPGTQYAPASPGYYQPGSTWREQRANQDWRNNTWREQRYNEDWRNNNWRQERANEDWQAREKYQNERTPNNAIDRGSVSATGTVTNAPSAPKKNGGAPITTKNGLMDAKNPADFTKKSAEEDCGFKSVGTPRPCLKYEDNKTEPDRSKDSPKTDSAKDKKPGK